MWGGEAISQSNAEKVHYSKEVILVQVKQDGAVGLGARAAWQLRLTSAQFEGVVANLEKNQHQFEWLLNAPSHRRISFLDPDGSKIDAMEVPSFSLNASGQIRAFLQEQKLSASSAASGEASNAAATPDQSSSSVASASSTQSAHVCIVCKEPLHGEVTTFRCRHLFCSQCLSQRDQGCDVCGVAGALFRWHL